MQENKYIYKKTKFLKGLKWFVIKIYILLLSHHSIIPCFIRFNKKRI